MSITDPSLVLTAAALKKLSEEIPNAGKLPAYIFLSRLIMLAIEKGLWKTGEIIPSERFFVREFKASPGTIKRAMLELVNLGILYRRRGSGTYVADSGFSREFRRYYLFLKNFNSPESENKITLLSKKTMDPDAYICRMLNIPSSVRLIELTRSYKEDGETIAVCRSYYDAGRFSALLDVIPARYERVPLFIILEEDFKIRALNSQELLSVEPLSGNAAMELNVSEGYPALCIKSLTFDHRKQPFELRVCHAKTESKGLFRNIAY